MIVDKIRKIHSIYDYVSLLKIFYGFFNPVESIIELYVDKNLLPDYKERRKASQIISDIEALDLNFNFNELLQAMELPEINSHEQAIAALYVLEGSTLGGIHIKKMITSRLQIDEIKGFSFFTGYGDQTLAKWEGFKEAIDKTAKSESDEQQILNAANDTFLKFGSWISKHP